MNLADFFEEITWRQRLHDSTPDAENQLASQPCTAYIGVDPTGPSLHIGHLATLNILVHFQRAGHRPIVLVGGATGMVGDPSGKSKERNLLDLQTIAANVANLKKQMENFLEFSGDKALIVNNYDWFKEMTLLDFLRDTGKHFSVNTMLARDSVQQRLATGLSFTEFSYQLLQSYDFLQLYQQYGCNIQMGGSDQWGNITAGTDLIRRVAGGIAHGMTFHLITRADGSKFGKTAEGQNVFLDASLTSPYQFYQFWVNVTDEDLPKMLRAYSLKSRQEIEEIEQAHFASPNERMGQKSLAEELVVRIHGAEALAGIQEANQILFGKSTKADLLNISEVRLREIAADMPSYALPIDRLKAGLNVAELFAESGIVGSKSEARRLAKSGGLKLNKETVSNCESSISTEDLLHGKFLLLQSGKKQFLLVYLQS